MFNFGNSLTFNEKAETTYVVNQYFKCNKVIMKIFKSLNK